MKLKALFLALAVAGAGASYALAADGHHDGGTTSTSAESPTTSQDCKRFHLFGTLVSTTAASFTINVVKGSHDAPAAGPQTIAVTPDTRVSWTGRGVVTGPNPGDSAWVGGKQCGGATGALTARNALFRTPGTHGGDHPAAPAHA
jgi:hypothetical protein